METCSSCQKPIAKLACGLCQTPLCKACARLIEADHFSYMLAIPADLSKETYCGPCFDEKVAPADEAYTQTMEQAKEVLVFLKSQSKETRLIRRKNRALTVKDCADEQELLMRLAFQAALAGCNALIDVDVQHRKVKMGGYQTTIWEGRAIPARVAERPGGADRVILRNPN